MPTRRTYLGGYDYGTSDDETLAWFLDGRAECEGLDFEPGSIPATQELKDAWAAWVSVCRDVWRAALCSHEAGAVGPEMQDGFPLAYMHTHDGRIEAITAAGGRSLQMPTDLTRCASSQGACRVRGGAGRLCVRGVGGRMKDSLDPILSEIDALRALPRGPAAASCAPTATYEPCVGAPLGGVVLGSLAPPARPTGGRFAAGVGALGRVARVLGWRSTVALARGLARLGRVRINGDAVAGWLVLAVMCLCAYSCSQKVAFDGAEVQRRVRQGDLGLDGPHPRTLGQEIDRVR